MTYLLSSLAHHLLLQFPPETAHSIAKFWMRHGLTPSEIQPWNPRTVFGMPLRNPIGLAAGFDKNGEVYDRALGFGFSFVEVGSVTLLGGVGNPKPRLFRLEEGLLNRMGLNGKPAQEVAANLEKRKYHHPQFGVNIAKTHSPEIMGDAAIRDIALTHRIMANLGFYHTLNISCPNTREGRTFEDPSALKELLEAVIPNRTCPLLVKLSSTLVNTPSLLEKIVLVCTDAGVDGFVACNTSLIEHPQHGRGGMSGPLLKELTYRTLVGLRTLAPGKTLIAVGGVQSGKDVLDYLRVGASLVQAYTGFVVGPFAGAHFVHHLVDQALIITCLPGVKYA